MERTLNGATKKTVKLIEKMTALMDDLPIPLRREVAMAIHKATYPMAEILAKVPGDSLTSRAKKLKVSRQTYYVWMNERFRPTRVQAKRISRITGVPIEHIVDDGWETKRAARRKADPETATVATGRRENPASVGGDKPRRRRKLDAGDRATAA